MPYASVVWHFSFSTLKNQYLIFVPLILIQHDRSTDFNKSIQADVLRKNHVGDI